MAMTRTHNYSHVIDIDGFGCWSQGEMYQNETGFPLIQKIERASVDTNAYEPYIVSIGPHHHGSPNVKATEKMKYDWFSYMLELNQDMKLANYVEAINGLEKQVRSCYADDIHMNKNKIVKMLLFDGCFLINTLRGLDGMSPPIFNSDISEDKAKIISMDEDNRECVIDIEFTQVDSSEENFAQFARILLRDLMLLENQIPFFVVTKIYEIVTGGNSAISLLEGNILRAMEEVLNRYPKANREYDRPIEIYHLLHLCHMYFKPSEGQKTPSYQKQAKIITGPSSFRHFLQLGNKFFRKNEVNLSQNIVYESQPINHWLRATQYNEARIELKKREYYDADPHSLLDIRFSNGTLTIPCLAIDPETCDLFRNLIAFEKMHSRFGNYITSYIIFWSHFAATPDDISLLVEKGIITHSHSDKEVSDLLKSLGDGTVLDFAGEYYLKSNFHMMEAHYQMWKPRWKEWIGSITSKILNLS